MSLHETVDTLRLPECDPLPAQTLDGHPPTEKGLHLDRGNNLPVDKRNDDGDRPGQGLRGRRLQGTNRRRDHPKREGLLSPITNVI